MVMPKDTESSKQKKEEKSPKTLVERTGIELTEDQLNSVSGGVKGESIDPKHRDVPY
jgi:bacteriocin-like protein